MGSTLLMAFCFIAFILLVTTPLRMKKKKNAQAVIAESGARLEDVPVKTLKVNGGNSYIDVNYVLFYNCVTSIEKYDIKTVKSTEITSERIQGNRHYYLSLKDVNGNSVGKGIYLASQKEAETLQAFIQKYINKIAAGE